MNETNSSQSSLIKTMLDEHSRFERLLNRLHELAESGEISQEAKDAAEELDVSLSRHIYAENEVLVPEMELTANSAETNAVGAMLQDHDRIRAISLRLLHMVTRDGDPADILTAVVQMQDTLQTHTYWEEEQVYPLLKAADPDNFAAEIMRGEHDDDVFGDSLLD